MPRRVSCAAQRRNVPPLIHQRRERGDKNGNPGEFAVASWARDGRGYMVIGKLPVKLIFAVEIFKRLIANTNRR